MANTLVDSKVVTQMVNEKMKGKGVLANLAVSLGNLPNGVHEGGTWVIEKFAHLGEMVNLAKGDAIPLEDIKATESQESIEHKAKGFIVYDIEKETSIGGHSIIDMKSEDLARIRVRALEKSLGSKLVNAPLQYAASSADNITVDDINEALVTAFGDDLDETEFTDGGIVINSKLLNAVMKMDEFVKIDRTYAKAGNGIIRNGLVGFWRGYIPVFLSDVTTYDTTKNECITYILKNGAIGYKDVAGELEVARNASKKADELYDDYMFVTGVINDTKAVVVRKTIPTPVQL